MATKQQTAKQAELKATAEKETAEATAEAAIPALLEAASRRGRGELIARDLKRVAEQAAYLGYVMADELELAKENIDADMGLS